MNFTTSPRVFDVLLAPLMAFLPGAVQAHNSDYRAHKFKAVQHVLLSVVAQLLHAPSTNALVEELNDLECEGRERNLRQLIGFEGQQWNQPLTLNQSSLSRVNAHRSYRLWRYAFSRLFQLAQRHCHPDQLEGLGRLVVVDGTLLDCLGRMGWAAYRQSQNKLKGHFFFDLQGLPSRLVLTTGKGSEREVLAANFCPGVTYLLDRGYNDYALCDQLQKAQAHFVTRLLKNAVWEAVADHQMPREAEQLGLVSDQTVRLGQPSNLEAKPRLVRLVVYTDAANHEWRYVTSRFDLDALTVVRLYLQR